MEKGALVIGAGRRMGREIARELARRGFGVAVNARRSTAEAEETVRLIEAQGGRALLAMGDAGDPAEAARAVSVAAEGLGRLDALVYCAAQRVHVPLADLTPGDWARALSSVLTGALLTCQAAAPHLRRQGGSITLISGASAFVGSAAGPATPAAKSGLTGLARALALELGPDAIRVNVLSPGRVDSPDDPPETRARMEHGRPEAGIPLRRAGTLADIAGVTAALSGPDFAYVTGQVIHVNGGFFLG